MKHKSLLFALCVLASTARADKTDFLVNDDASGTDQTQPRVAVAAGKGFISVWTDSRDGQNDIYLARYTPDGISLGRNLRVNSDTGSIYQAQPAVGVDYSGNYGSVWQDYRNGSYPFDPDIFLQRFDTSAARLGVNREITTEWPDSLKENPDVDFAPWGRGVVVWGDYRNRNWDIYGQRISSTGELIGVNFKINDDAGTAQQHAPRVSISPDGWFVVTWYDNRWGNDDIFVQRFDTAGTKRGVNLKVNSDVGTTRQAFPDVAADGVGHFTLVWVDWRNGIYPTNPDIYSRKYDTNLVALYSDRRMNTDGTARAQREPSIASDRLGNVAIIWSDSTSTSWDIVGQMIDVDGVVREPNFRANSTSDSAQQQPDVALDGLNRYIVWADRRNGQYDIYASIAKYNDPSLMPTPRSFRFDMGLNGSLPPLQNLVVDHAGYNRLHFTASASPSWLMVSPASGQTTDTLVVAIVNGSQPVGTHIGTVSLIDTDHATAPLTLPVRLDVTAPSLVVDVDTLRFTGYAFEDTTLHGQLAISSSNSLNFSWTALDTANWIDLTPAAGSTPGSVDVTIRSIGKPAGTYSVPVVIAAPSAAGSPDTVWVVLKVENRAPYIMTWPESVSVSTRNPETVSEMVIIRNATTGSLSWHATSGAPWLRVSKPNGGAEDTVRLTIAPEQIVPGVQISYVDFADSNSVNVTARVPFVLNYDPIPQIQVTPARVAITTSAPSNVATQVVVSNSGGGTLAWRAAIRDATWLSASSLSGDQQDTILLRVTDPSLATGVHQANIDFVEVTNPSDSVRVPFSLEVVPPTKDTIVFGSYTGITGRTIPIPVDIVLVNSATHVFVPVGFDTALVRADSVAFEPTLSTSVTKRAQIDLTGGRIGMTIDATGAPLPPGNRRLANMFFTTRNRSGRGTIDTTRYDTLSALVKTVEGLKVEPATIPGGLIVSLPTPVFEPDDSHVPGEYALLQNYPNPFNGGTSIGYELPEAGNVELSVFNVLGQRVATLVSDYRPSGRFQAAWNGTFDNGRAAPSGIYFYRLQTAKSSLVQKMALLK